MASKHTLVIAEAGVNHNGDLALAKELAVAARDAGADIVKYQVFDSAKLVTTSAQKASYQQETTGSDESQLEMLRRLELTRSQYRELREYCDDIGIKFLATPFDEESLSFLVEELGVDLIKIPSGELTNYPLLVCAASYGLPVIMSTGMSSMEEVLESLAVLREGGAGEVTLLHCNTQYPTPFDDVNLRAMLTLGDVCKCATGYSDHTLGTEVPIAAVALGATVIEKHFTLDRHMEGPDHRASLEPSELASMVRGIRNIELALGSGTKQVTESEKANRAIARKSIVARCHIEAGEMFTNENLTTKRPGDGLSPMMWNEVMGSYAKRDYEMDEKIDL